MSVQHGSLQKKKKKRKNNKRKSEKQKNIILIVVKYLVCLLHNTKIKFNFAAACYCTFPYPPSLQSLTHSYFYGTLHIDHTMRSLSTQKNKCTLYLTFTWLWILKQNVSFQIGSLQFLMVLVRTVSDEAVGKDRLT